MSPDPAVVSALAPVDAALRAAVGREVADLQREAAAECARTLAQAQQEATRIEAQAHSDGTADAATPNAIERAQASRDARAAVLTARGEAERHTRAAAHAHAAQLGVAALIPDLRDRLMATIRVLLDPRAELRETGDGGLIGEFSGRRVDFALSGFIDRATDAVLAEVADAEAAA